MSCRYRWLVVLATLSFLAGCAGGGGGGEPLPSESPPISGDAEDSNLLTIQKGALGEEFLLQSSIAVQQGYGSHATNPTSSALKSRIVVFEEQGDELLLLETSHGYQPGDELPAHKLITAFPIVERDGENVVFDFNKGMATVLLSWDWYGSDYGSAVWPDVAFSIDNSYLREVTAEPEAITAIQTLSMRYSIYFTPLLLPVEITYYITPYKENPNYTPVESPGFDYLGFFEANPLIQEDFGDAFTYITRWDISKPVTYYVSPAFPEEYRDAVREGVLYWNKVFGKEVMRAEIAPEEVTAPDFEHNIIQWHTDHNAPYAYADAQMDPRTGEILHAQIFIPSVFTEWYRAYGIAEYDRKLGEEEGTEKGGAEGGVAKDDVRDYFLSARQLEESRLCQLTLDDLLDGIYMQRDVVNALPPERIESLTIDLLRRVVAHEVGHTLGLRHNFAASTVNEWGAEEEEDIVRRYFREGVLPGDIVPPANSVMDYHSYADKIIIGALIGREEAQPLPYDSYAMQWGYFGADQDPVYEGHPFCTDSQVWYFEDCALFDAGAHLMERRAYETRHSFEKIPWLLSEAYLAAKANYNPRYRRPVAESTPSAWYLSASVIGPWYDLIELFIHEPRLLSIYREHPDYTDIDSEDVKAEAMDWLNFEIAYAGGIDKVLQLIDPEVFQKVVRGFPAEFKKIITSEELKAVPLSEGGSISFSEEEIDYMLKRADKLFPEVDEALASGITSSLALIGSNYGDMDYMIEHVGDIFPGADGGLDLESIVRLWIFSDLKLLDSIEGVEAILARWAEYVITTTPSLRHSAPEPTEEGGGEESPAIARLDFRYSIGTRRKAAGLLIGGGPLPEWLDVYIPPVADKLREQLETAFGMPIENINLKNFPRRDRQRIAEELGVYYMLAGSGVIPIPYEDMEEPGQQREDDSGEALGWMQKLLR